MSGCYYSQTQLSIDASLKIALVSGYCVLLLIIIPIIFCFHPISCFQSVHKCWCLCVKENCLTIRTGDSEEFLDMGKLRTEFYILEGKGDSQVRVVKST